MMRSETRGIFQLVQQTLARWHEAMGLKDVRGSEGRRDAAEMMRRYRRMLRRREFIDRLRRANSQCEIDPPPET